MSKIDQYKHVLHGKMMDFGCGSKPYKSIFTVDEYVGVDFMNEGHPHDQEQIDVFYDGKSIPLQSNYFDSVLSSEVFEHIFNLEEILDELNRVLKSGGRMLITCPFVWKEHEVPHDYARYTRFALKHLFNKHGFEVIQEDKSGNFIEVIFQLIVLYFHDYWFPKVSRIPVARQLFQFFFFALPNLTGAVLSKLFRKRKEVYFNNIFIVEKR